MWKQSFVTLLCGVIVFAVPQEYDVNPDPNFVVDVRDNDGVQGSKAKLIFSSDSVTVDPGQRLQLDCGVQGKFRSCFWVKGLEEIQIEDVHGQYLKGLSKPESLKGNECGIVINSVSHENHGEWVCKVFVPGGTLEGSKNVIVTVKPQKPTLDINEKPLVVAENEIKELSCTVAAARPAARVRWFVGTEDITSSSNTESIPTDDMGTYRSVSTLKYKFHYLDDEKSLTCRIEHPTLQEPEFAEVPLDVRFKPYPLSSTKIYSIPLENEYEIKYNLTSNPLPQMSWFINGNEIAVPSESGRYQTDIRDFLNNLYMATLKIRDFSSEDLGLTYRLHAENDQGEKDFEISLSTAPAPPDTIGTGTIAAIIVIVVFILILLFIIGVMRYRQMYCFGPKDKIKNHLKESGENLKEEHSDTESARQPNGSKGKASNLFKNLSARIKTKKTQKEPRLDKVEEGECNEEVKDEQSDNEGKCYNSSEVVYAELVLNKNNKDIAKDKANDTPNTEYAEIIGTVPDNTMREKKECIV